MNKIMPSFVSWARLERLQQSAFERSRLRWLLLVVVLVLIPIWQLSLWNAASTLDDTYINEGSSGGGAAGFSASLPFKYYLGLSPVTFIPQAPYSDNLSELQAYCKGDISKTCLSTYVRENGSRMLVGPGYEPFQVYLFYPDLWVRGDLARADVRPATALGFCVALMALFAALWAVRLSWLGLVLVIAIGSNPFLLFESYTNSNVFTWLAIVALVCLALAMPAMKLRPARFAATAAAAMTTGAVIATFQYLRPEIFALSAAGFVIFITLSKSSWVRRLAATGVFLLSLIAVGQAWKIYYEKEHAQAQAVVKAGGGTVSPQIERAKWFTVWAGLGDFDDKYGYLWDDRAAYYFALNAQPPGAKLDPTLRDDVLSNIVRDPLWYARILVKRVWRVLAENTPPSLAAAGHQVRLPIPGPVVGALTLAVILLLCLGRSWFLLKLLAFPAALAATPLLIYSGHGIAYYSMVHLFALAVLAALLVELILMLAAKLRASEPVVISDDQTGMRSGPLKEAEA